MYRPNSYNLKAFPPDPLTTNQGQRANDSSLTEEYTSTLGGQGSTFADQLVPAPPEPHKPPDPTDARITSTDWATIAHYVPRDQFGVRDRDVSILNITICSAYLHSTFIVQSDVRLVMFGMQTVALRVT